jgi:hypothetical protein
VNEIGLGQVGTIDALMSAQTTTVVALFLGAVVADSKSAALSSLSVLK